MDLVSAGIASRFAAGLGGDLSPFQLPYQRVQHRLLGRLPGVVHLRLGIQGVVLANGALLADDVVSDGVEPGAEAAGFPVARQGRQRLGEDLLRGILRRLLTAEQAVAVAVHPGEVAVIDRGEGGVILACMQHQVGVVQRHQARVCLSPPGQQ